MPEIYTKRGDLSAYGFVCGYVSYPNVKNERFSLYVEHGVYHLRGYINNKKIWESARTLREIRKTLSQLRKS